LKLGCFATTKGILYVVSTKFNSIYDSVNDQNFT